MHYFYIYPLVGIVAGFIAGLLGLGGGVVVVPCLVIIFPLLGIDAAQSVHLAIGTSMATVVVTQISSVLSHFKHADPKILWQLGKRLWPGVIVGAICGVVIANLLSAKFLALFFGIVVLLLALRVALIKKHNNTETELQFPWHLPNKWVTTIIMYFIGGISALLGMGGGVYTVPFLQHCKVPMRLTIAMSAFVGVPLSIVATLTYVILGHALKPPVPWSTGSVYWPAFVGIAVMTMLVAPFGVKLAHKLPAQVLRWLFVLFLVFVGLKMVLL